jgi:excisionase family DNA binding protein
MPIDRLLTTKEAATVLGMTVTALRHRLRRRQIPGVKMGHKWMVRESEITAYMASLPSFGPLVTSTTRPPEET